MCSDGLVQEQMCIWKVVFWMIGIQKYVFLPHIESGVGKAKTKW